MFLSPKIIAKSHNNYIFYTEGLMVDLYGRFNAMDAEAMIDVMSVVRLCRFVRIFALIVAVFLLIYGFDSCKSNKSIISASLLVNLLFCLLQSTF